MSKTNEKQARFLAACTLPLAQPSGTCVGSEPVAVICDFKRVGGKGAPSESHAPSHLWCRTESRLDQVEWDYPDEQVRKIAFTLASDGHARAVAYAVGRSASLATGRRVFDVMCIATRSFVIWLPSPGQVLKGMNAGHEGDFDAFHHAVIHGAPVESNHERIAERMSKRRQLGLVADIVEHRTPGLHENSDLWVRMTNLIEARLASI